MTHNLTGLTCIVFASGLLLPYHSAQAAVGAGAFDKRCYSDVPAAQTAPDDINQQPVEISADSAEATKDGKAVYRGDVQLFQGLRTLNSNYTELDQNTRELTAEGKIFYQDGQITLRSNQMLHSNLNSRQSTLEQAEYQLHGSPARGSADRINLDDKQKEVELQGAQFTTCPPGQEMWWLKASSVKVDQNEVFGEAWNATIWLHDMPVFYTPYMTFPVKDERKSGLLYPSFTYSDSYGTDFRTPYYWNIAPNYDMTFTPRFIQKRGTMLQDEFRYMPTPEHQGVLYGEYLGTDRKLEQDQAVPGYAYPEVNRRWLANVRHSSSMEDGTVRLGTDFTRVAADDYNYFNDFSPPVGSLVDNQLMQSLTAGYYQKDWNLTSEVRDYQILLPDALAPHQMLPRLNYNQYWQYQWLDLGFNGEIVNFAHNSELHKSYTGQRFHLEPVLTVPLARTTGAKLDAQFKLMYTRYQQDVPDDLDPIYAQYGLDDLDENVTRTLPSVRVNGGLVFDRIGSWNQRLYTQTLEPQFQYLYVPYKDQNHIGLYDSTTMRQDYYSLFSDRRFAGLDRISDANQVSLGVTSRIFDNNSVERLRLMLGQSYNLVNPKVTLVPIEEQATNTRSLLTFDGDAHPVDDWFLRGGVQYDTEHGYLSAGNSAVEYRNDGYMGQLNYRFVRQGNVVYDAPYKQTDISQLGALTTIPIDGKWNAIAAYYRDIKQKNNIDRLIGLQYDSCCWKVNLVVESENKPDNTTLTATQETRFGIEFEMKGLGSVGSGTNYSLNTQLLPYIRPFNLND